MKAVYVSQTPIRDSVATPARRPVAEVMSSPVICVHAETPVGEALRTMVASRCRHLVVVDDGGRCRGVLADRAMAALWADDPDSFTRQVPVGPLAYEAATVAETARVVDAARVMRDCGSDAVAVVNEAGAPLGIITGTDLIRLLSR